MVSSMLKPKLIIHENKLIENYNYYQNFSETVICVVKSNGYGTNITRLVSILLKNGANYFAVFSLKEALAIRKINKDCFILLLNSVEKEDLLTCFNNKLTISINSYKDYQMLLNQNYQGNAQIKFDTGMHRYGVSKQELLKIIKQNKIKISGIFSHLIGGQENYLDIQRQVRLFDETLEKIDTKDLLIHICSTNSCPIISSKYQNAIRIGMGLFGVTNHINPAFSIYLPISLKRFIRKNKSCSYNKSFITPSDGYLYIIPLGYYNFLLPDTKIAFKGFINAGKICMNCLILFNKFNYRKKAITLSGYDFINLCKYNNYSPYWLLSSFTS